MEYIKPYKDSSKPKIRRYNKVKARDDYTCQYCGDFGNTVDHIIPRKHGGLSTQDNLVCCCLLCNQILGDSLFDNFEEKKKYLQFEMINLLKRRFNSD